MLRALICRQPKIADIIPCTMKLARILFLAALSALSFAQNLSTSQEIRIDFPAARALYLDLHENPELSSHKTQTAAKLASLLLGPGYEVHFTLGGAYPRKYAEAKIAGTKLPFNHSPLFAPDVDPALRTGIVAEAAVLRNLLNTSPSDLHKLTHQQAEP